MKYKILDPTTLREYIKLCIDDPDNASWMVMDWDTDSYKMDMQLFQVELKNYDIEPEEYDEIEDEVNSKGLCNCLSSDQIADVEKVLRKQKQNYTEKDLERALDYYSEKDTFMELNDV